MTLTAIKLLTSNIWSKVRIYVIGLTVLTALSGIGASVYLYKQNKQLDVELGQAINNARQYAAIANQVTNDNRVLKLNLSDLSHSNDSLVISLNEMRKSLRIKENALREAHLIQSQLTDSITGILDAKYTEKLVDLPVDICDFEIELVSDITPLTAAKITRVAEKVSWVPDIKNAQALFVTTEKEYRNPGKKFFKRLFTWDWKKDIISRYQIINSNLTIDITETRVIQVNTKQQ